MDKEEIAVVKQLLNDIQAEVKQASVLGKRETRYTFGNESKETIKKVINILNGTGITMTRSIVDFIMNNNTYKVRW